MTEGAVGGWVNIHTMRPFDGDGGFKGLVSLKSKMSPGADTELTDPNSLNTYVFVSNTFNDKFGASFMYNNGDYNGRADIMEDLIYIYDDKNGDGSSEYSPVAPRYFQNLVQEERESFTGSLQYRPTEDLEFIFDATHSERSGDVHNYVVNYIHFPGWGTNSNIIIEDETVVGFDNEGGLFQSLSSEFTETRETDTYSLTADWRTTEDLTISAIIGSSEGVFDQPLVNIQFNKFNIPLHTMDRAGEDNIWRTTDDLANYGSMASEYAQYTSIFSQDKTDQKEALAQLDFQYSIDNSFIEMVEFGVQLRNTEFDHTGAKLNRNVDQQNAPADYVSNSSALHGLPAEFGSEYKNNPDGIPGNFWVPDSEIFLDTFYTPEELSDIANYDEQYLDPGKVWNIEEKVSSAYVQVNFFTEFSNDMALSGNFGLRYSKTETDTHGFANVIESGFDDPVSFSSDYSDILPALNLTLEVTQSLLFRFAASQVIARPKITDLVPSLTYNEVTKLASGGNPDLDPFRADQFDLLWSITAMTQLY